MERIAHLPALANFFAKGHKYHSLAYRVRHMARAIQLGLHEQLVLLALDVPPNRKRARLRTQWLGFGVAGAILFMLLRSGRVTIERDRITARGKLTLSEFGLETLLTELEAKIGPFKRPRPSAWLRRVAGLKALNHVLLRLEVKGILKPDKGGFRLMKPGLRNDLEQRLRETVIEGKVASEETAALAALVEAINVFNWLWVEDGKRQVKQKFRILGRQAGPAIPAVRTAVAERKLAQSIASVFGAAAGTGITFLLIRACSS